MMKKPKPADYLFWAVSQNTGNSLRDLILIKLCNRAGKNGSCYPSFNTIAKDCSCTSRAVRMHVRALEQMGMISIERRCVDGMKTSNLYTFPLVKSDRNEVPNDRNIIPKGRELDSLGVGNEVPIKHPLLNTQLNTTPYSPPSGESDFDKFYAAYPKKVGRQAAQKAWDKLNPHQALITRIMQDIVDRVEQGHWCTGKGKQYIPGPAPYLNQEKWTDEIIPRPEFKPKINYSELAANVEELKI
jgi:hypothetical protein